MIDPKAIFREMLAELERNLHIGEERMEDSRWQLEDICVMSPASYEINQNSGTPIDVKHRILLATYQGRRWVQNDRIQNSSQD